jgi:DNA-binding MarR family transcriptional regulator
MSTIDSALAREIKQTKPFRSVSEEAAIGLMRTADVIRRGFSAVVESEGITLQQYNVLRILRGAGERGLPTLEIADRLVEHAPGITRMIDRLIAKKLAARDRCAEDRRIVYCAITGEGREVVGRLDDPMLQESRAALDPLGKQDQCRLIAMLDALRARHAERLTLAGAGIDPIES